MIVWFTIFIALFGVALVIAAMLARRQLHNTDDFMMAGSNLGFVLGGLTVSATLFSVFIVLGMPDFFRRHGIGAWVFLAVADSFMAFVIVWFGLHLRRQVRKHKVSGLAELLRIRYASRWAGVLYVVCVFIFLIPYIAVQLRGVGLFLNASFPGVLPVAGWASLMVAVMLAYSESGGLRAIIYADALQSLILMTAMIGIGVVSVNYFGSVGDMFATVAQSNEALLSVPGPQGLFTTQFLLISLIAIALMPVTQPQVVMRLIIMRDQQSLNKMAIILGVMAIILIAALVPIGMLGAVNYPDLPTDEFLQKIFVIDQKPFVAAAIAVGLIAAAISTADSQLFALGNEIRSSLDKDESKNLKQTRIAIGIFAMASILVAIFSNNNLVLLARVSFVGTVMMAPLIMAAVMSKQVCGQEIVLVTALGEAMFLLSTFGVVPRVVYGISTDLIILAVISFVAVLSTAYRSRLAVNGLRPSS